MSVSLPCHVPGAARGSPQLQPCLFGQQRLLRLDGPTSDGVAGPEASSSAALSKCCIEWSLITIRPPPSSLPCPPSVHFLFVLSRKTFDLLVCSISFLYSLFSFAPPFSVCNLPLVAAVSI